MIVQKQHIVLYIKNANRFRKNDHFSFLNKKVFGSDLSFPSGPEPLSEFKTKYVLFFGDNSILIFS